MLTDEELAELEAAVDAYDNGHANDWPFAAEECAKFTRDAIARERAMRQPLTAEICERLGMVKHKHPGLWYMGPNQRTAFWCAEIKGEMKLHGAVSHWIKSPTVGHLFAAAMLAGVELDWRKVGG